MFGSRYHGGASYRSIHSGFVLHVCMYMYVEVCFTLA